MTDENTHPFDGEQTRQEFARLFPPEYWNVTAPGEFAPLGWDQSPLRLTFHPSVEQVYEEAVRTHRNLVSLRKAAEPLPPEPTRAEVEATFRETPLDAQREVRELLGMCLWDIISDGHEVVTPAGKVLDLGSFRGTGDFIADYLNAMLGRSQYDYLDFYLGTIWVGSRADLTPVYESIFRRLKGHGFDWVYHFPRIHLVDLRPLGEARRPRSEPEWLDYSPERAFAEQKAEEERDAEIAKMRAELDESHQEALEEARRHPPPATVRAYRAVFLRDPRGWPP